MSTIRYTTWENKTTTDGTVQTAEWPALIAALRSLPERASKGACKLIKLATFEGNTRRAGSRLENVYGIEGDYDGELISMGEAAARLSKAGVRAFLYTSASHTPEKPRWRAIAPLSRVHTPSERYGALALLNGALGGILAPESFDPSRCYFSGKVRGVPYDTRTTEGECIDTLDLTITAVGKPNATPVLDAPTASQGAAWDVSATPELCSDLRSALCALRADDRALWVRMGQALHELGDAGRALWLEWSYQSDKFDAHDAATTWDTFKPNSIHFQSVFHEATLAGWANPAKGVGTAGSGAKYTVPVEVSIFDVFDDEPEPPKFTIGELVPSGVVTLLGANGGAGKSMLALTAAVCVAMGLPFLGKPTMRGKVLFYSAEDAGQHLRHRLGKICRHLAVNPHDLAGSLTILDVTATEAALFHEVSPGGVKRGAVTPAYDYLTQRVANLEIDFLIVDNASDTYDANEIDRARVRGFIRSLVQLVKQRNGAVLLLAHVDKASAKGFASSQGYSGSTAWNNSVRSRLFMATPEGKETRLRLEHQKSNFGPMAAPMWLAWAGGVLDLAVQSEAETTPDDNLVDVLRLFDEFYRRSEWVSAASNSPDNPYRKFHNDSGYPANLAKADLISLIREAEREGFIQRESYTHTDRKTKERWALTETGVKRLQFVPSVPSVPSNEVGTVA
ncbi:MAG: AAA family ATPase [Cypionkella sp.]